MTGHPFLTTYILYCPSPSPPSIPSPLHPLSHYFSSLSVPSTLSTPSILFISIAPSSPCLYLLLQIMLHSHHHLAQLVPLLCQTHCRMLCVSEEQMHISIPPSILQYITVYHSIPQYITCTAYFPVYRGQGRWRSRKAFITSSLYSERITVYQSIPQYTTVYHSIPQYTTVYYSIPQYTTVYHSIPQYITVYYSIPQYTTVYHSISQYTTVYYSIPQ